MNIILPVLKNIRNNLQNKKKIKFKLHQANNIKIAIQKNQEYFTTNRSHMIANILEKSYKPIIIDKVSQNNNFIDNPPEVLEAVKQHFYNWTRKRTTKSWPSDEWKNQYEPKSHISNNAFNSIMNPISNEEFEKTINESSSHKAPGSSGIQNILIKNASSLLKQHLLEIYNLCLLETNMPDKWKNAVITLIPKPKEWEGNLDITRPITLIETARKGLSKILTNRITTICKSNSILKGNNFSVLKDTSTSVPLHTLNNLFEDARQFKKEIWCAFQDMRRAYDSVSWSMLKLALQRIKMNSDYIQLLDNLQNNRNNQV